jgi:hypothetical protein
MITPNHKQDEFRDIWHKLLDLHSDMKLGNQVTHPMRNTVAELSKRVMDLSDEMNRCRIYVPEASRFNPNVTQEMETPTADALTPLHPTTNPHGE